MVGLSVVLEPQKSSSNNINKKIPQVINKTTIMLSSINNNKSSPSPPLPLASSHHSLFQALTFLDQCFLCRKRLLPGKDIYMYKGDTAFCSVDCRYKQILTDEEEANQQNKCSLAARRHRKGARNQPGGGLS